MTSEHTTSATYIGPNCGWNLEKGMRVLLRPSPGRFETVLVQFDDFHAQLGGVDLAFGWHEFPSEHFELDKATGEKT